MTLRLFLSSVQKELAPERAALRDWLEADPLMRRFFDVFLFEDVPARDRRADQLYLDEVQQCDIYLGLFGNDYGYEDAEGVSPTEREFDEATRLHKTRLIFVKGTDDSARHPKMAALIRRAGEQLIRRRFNSNAELIGSVYAALVQLLEERELIRTGPFDAAPCPKATLADLDDERMATFIRRARRARNFPLPEEATSEELLTHLNLLDDGRPTNAAVLLFGRQPQRFLISSEIKCAHFHGTEAAKPIPSYQVYKGTVFDLVDQAVDFVMSKITLRVGTRAEGPQAPVEYEIPQPAIAEAIVNAVAHRDYTSNGSVQVMLFSDRLEVWNPGGLPPSLTLEKLRQPHASVPFNPLLAEPLYLARYIERMGTGTRDMIRLCREAGLPEPQFSQSDGFVTTIRRPESGPESALTAGEVTGEVAGEVSAPPDSAPESRARPESGPESRPESLEMRILTALEGGPLSKSEIAARIGHREISGRLNKVIRLLVSDQTAEYTLPDKPNSRMQRYRLTEHGNQILTSLRKGDRR